MENRRGLSTAVAIELRSDYTANGLRQLARSSRDAKQVGRLIALTATYDGANRTLAARIRGVALQIVHDWIVRFNLESPAGLADRKEPGREPSLTAKHGAALALVVGISPRPYLHEVAR